MALRDYAHFAWQFLRHPIRVGAVAPSSRGLARCMVSSIDWNSVQTLVEYGPGTGVFTQQVLRSKPPDTRVIAVELNSEFARTLHERFDEVEVVQESVGNIEAICDRLQVSQIDAVVCGLPWAAFSEVDQVNYLEALMRVLRPDGQFMTFAYLQGLLLPAGGRFRRQLQRTFRQVQTSRTVWANLPPAFVYHCRR